MEKCPAELIPGFFTPFKFRIFYLQVFLFIIFLFTPKVEAATVFQVKEILWNSNKVLVLTLPSTSVVLPVASMPGNSVTGWAKKEGAIAAINGGYFNHSDGWPVSKVIVNGIPKTEPEKNKALINNKILKPILFKIFNERVEFRTISNGKNIFREIVPHNKILNKGFKISSSIQAGPLLLPSVNLEKEGFIIKNTKGKILRDSIGSGVKTSRSAIGLTGKGEILFVGVSASGKGKGVTIYQLAEIMKELKSVSAMALDGGSSTSITWKENKIWKTFIGKGKYPPVVNSALIVLK